MLATVVISLTTAKTVSSPSALEQWIHSGGRAGRRPALKRTAAPARSSVRILGGSCSLFRTGRTDERHDAADIHFFIMMLPQIRLFCKRKRTDFIYSPVVPNRTASFPGQGPYFWLRSMAGFAHLCYNKRILMERADPSAHRNTQLRDFCAEPKERIYENRSVYRHILSGNQRGGHLLPDAGAGAHPPGA